MTVSNIGDEPAQFEDIFEATELSDEVVDDGVEGGSMWEDVTLEESPGEVGVGEEVSGTLFYDVEEDDKYELFINAGLSSTSRSEEHTSELQSRFELVCRLLREN